MYKSKKILVLASLVIVSLSAGTVYAQSSPKNTRSGSSLEQRIAQRKAERKITLDEKNTKRLQSSCIRSQTEIRALRDQYVDKAANRSKVYNRVDAKLWIAIGSLKLIEQDTFRLEQQRAELLKRVNAYENNYKQFYQALDDASNMNCEADVVGFQSLIATSRIYNDQIRDQLNDITKYINDNIRPLLGTYSEKIKVEASKQ